MRKNRSNNDVSINLTTRKFLAHTNPVSSDNSSKQRKSWKNSRRRRNLIKVRKHLEKVKKMLRQPFWCENKRKQLESSWKTCSSKRRVKQFEGDAANAQGSWKARKRDNSKVWQTATNDDEEKWFEKPMLSNSKREGFIENKRLARGHDYVSENRHERKEILKFSSEDEFSVGLCQESRGTRRKITNFGLWLIYEKIRCLLLNISAMTNKLPIFDDTTKAT